MRQVCYLATVKYSCLNHGKVSHVFLVSKSAAELHRLTYEIVRKGTANLIRTTKLKIKGLLDLDTQFLSLI